MPGQARLGATIERRVLHLVRDQADARILYPAQSLDAHVRRGNMANLARRLQVPELARRVLHARDVVAPPVILNEVQAIEPEA